MKRLALAAAGVVCVVVAVVQAGGAAPGTAFTNFSVSATPGTVCPGSSKCTNGAAEPAIRADGNGTFFGSSENGLGGGTIAVRSTDGGLHYVALPSPNQGSTANNTGFAPGGGDTDLAVAPAKNAKGNFNVYVSSLTLANVDVSTSTDNGATWTLNPVTTPETIDDREWIAADGAQKVCISYHNAPQGITVGCSANAGLTFTQFAPAIDAAHSYQTSNNAIGNMAIDPASHTIYQTYSAITSATEVACAPQVGVTPPSPCDYHGVYMAISTNGGSSFTDYPVYVNPDKKASYGHQFVNVSVDRAGNVYSVFCDNHHIYVAVSHDHGKTWTKPVQSTRDPVPRSSRGASPAPRARSTSSTTGRRTTAPWVRTTIRSRRRGRSASRRARGRPSTRRRRPRSSIMGASARAASRAAATVTSTTTSASP